MKKILASSLGLALLATPALALAGTMISPIPIEQTPLQLLTTVAAIEAQEAAISNGTTLACAALFGSPSVAVGQQVVLAWGSVGAVSQTFDPQNEWPQHGASTLSFSKTGTWIYSFTFYNAQGGSATCSAKIVVR